MGKKKWNEHRSKSSRKNKNKKINKNLHSNKAQFNNKFPVYRTNTSPITLFEKDVSITEYITTVSGFTGTIKERFSDFQVNEIDADGMEVRLTDLNLPESPKIDNPISESKPEVIKLITVELWNEINEVARSSSKDDKMIEFNVDDLTKDQRSLIHRTIKNVHGCALIGSTIDKNSKKYIQFKRFQKSNKPVDQRSRWLWPHEYTYFVLHKTNIDTLKATAELAKNLRLNASRILYAGTKDKRAKTSQWCCLRKIEPELIHTAAKRIPMVNVGNFTFRFVPLKLGYLKGNRFRIALRNVIAEENIIENAMTAFRDTGFINYYGLQRFGNNASIPTYKIGLALLQAKFKEACELILQPRDGDAAYMIAVRENWWKHRNAAKALSMLHRNNKSVEAKLLAGLAKHGSNDYVNALENIPRNMRLLYIHAYQSLIWNEIASRRIREFGQKICIGDLVFVNNVDDEENIKDTLHKDDDNDNKELSADDDDNSGKNGTTNQQSTESIFKSLVKPLAQNDIDSEQYSIFDVVLPLPGHDITYPGNDMGKWYQQRLAIDGLSSEKLKLKQKTYSLCGAYRKLVVKPEKLTWTVRKYTDVKEDLIRSDLDELLNENNLNESDGGNYQALIIDLWLPSSAYATMALREILKQDTSKTTQKQSSNLEQETKIPDGINEKTVLLEKQKPNETIEMNENAINTKKIKSI